MSITIGLITDIHHGPDSDYVRGSAALPLLKAALADLEMHGPVLFIDLGDRANGNEPEQARAQLNEVAEHFRKLNVPRVHLRGNHDVAAIDEQKAILEVPLGNRNLKLGSWQLVFIDTFDGTVEGALSPKTLTWLAQVLAETPLPTAVFSHQPLDGQPLLGSPFFGDVYSFQAHPKGHAEARRIIERSGGVRVVVSGHAHWNHRADVGGVTYLTLDALAPLQECEALGAYGLLTLSEASVRLEVFGRDPQRLELSWGV